jgi:hypothetical protein
VYPATAPPIIVAGAAAGIAATQEDWPRLGVAIAVIAVATGSAFAGPVGAWAFTGVGCRLALLGYAATQVIWQRRG